MLYFEDKLIGVGEIHWFLLSQMTNFPNCQKTKEEIHNLIFTINAQSIKHNMYKL